MRFLKTSGVPTEKTKTSNDRGPIRLHGVIGLAVGVLFSALGTALMRHGDFGLSSFYAVSLALYHASGILTMGTWNTIFQIILMLILVFALRRVRWGYLASFLVVIVSSALIDQFSVLTAKLPEEVWVRVFCYLVGLLILSAGISLLATCKLPVMPLNLFVREMAEAVKWPFGRFKLCFDVACLTFSAVVGLLFTGSTPGVGWGTVCSVFAVGPLTQLLISVESKWIEFFRYANC